MKKNLKLTLASLLTAAILFIGFNSFTQKDKKVAAETPYFWYDFDDANNIVGILLNPGGKVTKTVAMSTLTPCPDGGGVICIRAYDTNDKEDVEDNTTPSSDLRVLYE